MSGPSSTQAAAPARRAGPARSQDRPRIDIRTNTRERKLVEAARKLQRRSRERRQIFPDPVFANPCWDMLVEAYLAQAHGAGLTIMEACLAAGTPKTSALRHIGLLCERGLMTRMPNPCDQRSSLVALTEAGQRQLRAYLERISG
jgi:hypothetical protein